MKEATGELNMTVVTLVAVAALGALFYFVMWPMIQRMIVQQTCGTYGPEYKAVKKEGEAVDTGSNAVINNWMCCKDGQASGDCIDYD